MRLCKLALAFGVVALLASPALGRSRVAAAAASAAPACCSA